MEPAGRTMTMRPERERRKRPESYGALAAGLAHEIRNPLSTISVNLQLLAEDFAQPQTPLEQRTLKRTQRLLGEVRRLEQIVADFLGLARGYELKRETVDLELLLADLARASEPENARHGIRLRLQTDPDARFVLADPGFLRVALGNLILNAQQALAGAAGESAGETPARASPPPESGEILLETRGRENDVEVRVTDTGPGIPRELQERVFRPWFSTRSGGTGLGLPMARRIAEELGGELLLYSDPGRGTRFTLRLPRAPRQLTAGGQAPSDGGRQP